jgi:hypothetical protein
MVGHEPARYRCRGCGNMTRFDVVESRRTRSFYHFSIGGSLRIEEEEVLDRSVEDVVCRWCNSASQVEALGPVAQDLRSPE